MTYLCPKGHASTDADYCSECGALMGKSMIETNKEDMNSNASNISKVNTADKNELCPDCGTPRMPGSRFCEACRHDFYEDKKTIVKNQDKENDIEKKENLLKPNNIQEQENNNMSANFSNTSEKLSVIISVDNSRVKDDPEMSSVCPISSVDKIFHLDLEENLLGRRSVAKGISPEIEINDPGVSHRHLKFIKNINGSFDVLDLGSANGTILNGKELESGVEEEIKIGDELLVGLWTKIVVTKR